MYVYDGFGQLAAEYRSTAGSITPSCTICYLTTDYLGTTRMVTDSNGNVVARHDFLPFGEEVPAGYAGRNGPWGGDDSVAQKFTGQIRDAETNLDFFNARYMSAAQGRFLSPDPFNAGADPTDPQTWNAYAYMRGNPLNLVDPTGMDSLDAGDPGDCEDDGSCWDWPIFPPPFGGGPLVPQIPPPPPPPTPITIQNTTGVYAQGQWGGYPGGNNALPVPANPGTAQAAKAALIDLILRVFLLDLIRPPYLDTFDGNHRLFGTHHCGPGGGGESTGPLDDACIAHDTCYDDNKLVWTDNNRSLPPAKQKDLQRCNQQFCDALKQLPGVNPAAAREYFKLLPRTQVQCQ